MRLNIQFDPGRWMAYLSVVALIICAGVLASIYFARWRSRVAAYAAVEEALQEVNGHLVHVDTPRLKFYVVDLSDTRVNDSQLNEISHRLSRIAGVENINLDNTLISDAGLVNLHEITDLESLSLNGTRISDGGITSLAKIKHLTDVSLSRTQVSERGVQSLKASRPGISVTVANETQMPP